MVKTRTHAPTFWHDSISTDRWAVLLYGLLAETAALLCCVLVDYVDVHLVSTVCWWTCGTLTLLLFCIAAVQGALASITTRRSGFPRWWRLFSFGLPRRIRKRCFDPAYEELLEDYFEAKTKYRTKGARRWLTIAFTFRTILMVLDCVRAVALDATVACVFRIWRVFL